MATANKAKTNVENPVVKLSDKRGKAIEIKKQPSKRLPTMLTLKEASALIGVNLFTVKVWCKEGRFPFVKSGTRYLINEAHLLKFLGGAIEPDDTDEGWD